MLFDIQNSREFMKRFLPEYGEGGFLNYVLERLYIAEMIKFFEICLKLIWSCSRNLKG